MEPLDKRRFNTDSKGLESKEGERRCLSSNSAGIRSPSLDTTPLNSFESEEAAVSHLASILVDLFLYYEANPNAKQKSRDLLSRLNKGTG